MKSSRFGTRFADTFAPSLEQTVAAIAGWDGATAFVEVKRSSLRRFGREPVLTRIAEVLQPVLDKCVLISFDLPSVKVLRQMTRARVGWVLEAYDAATHAAAVDAAPEFLFCNLERVPAAATELWIGPWQWAIYEVRDLATARHCQSLGATHVESMTVRALQEAFATGRAES